jgi:thymidylate kinase
MLTVALIGGDGAGKTTIGTLLKNSLGTRVKYLYMGSDFESSNFALPTSRMIHYIRKLIRSKKIKLTKIQNLIEKPEDRTQDSRGKISATLRMINRIAEEWYRQMISMIYQIRGYNVIYDRHFIFDYLLLYSSQDKAKKRLTDRIHWYILDHWIPKPNLVFFLDAPPEVLFQRKKETNIEYLNYSRKIFHSYGEKHTNFIVVDGSKSPELVLENIMSVINSYK